MSGASQQNNSGVFLRSKPIFILGIGFTLSFITYLPRTQSMEPQQQQALSLLVSGKSVDEISEELDIHRTTLWRWRKQPDFIAGWNQMIKTE